MPPYAYPKHDPYIKVYVNDEFYMSSDESKIDAIIDYLNNMNNLYVESFFYFEKRHKLLVTMDYRIPQDLAE